MRLCFISDTHSLHHALNLPRGDILIHCGDFTGYGELAEVEDFAAYFATQAFPHKVVIAGNHDVCFDNESRQEAESILKKAGITYLNDSGATIAGLKFWGSPIQPTYYDWAFQRQRGAAIRQHWDLIPTDTDILITHGPAYGILDLCASGHHAGCEALREVVQTIKPRIHACGHIHEGYGVQTINDTTFINACSLDVDYCLKHSPIVLDIEI